MPTQITALAAGKPLDGRSVLDPVTCSLAGGERAGVIDENGSGKSTLLRVLAGELAPDSGHVTRRGRIGCLPQEPHPGGPDETLPAAFARGRAGEAAQHTDRLLSLGLFDRDQLTVRGARLSTGQRQRLALARMVSEPSDVLLLDEPVLLLDGPANHLPPPSSRTWKQPWPATTAPSSSSATTAGCAGVGGVPIAPCERLRHPPPGPDVPRGPQAPAHQQEFPVARRSLRGNDP